MIKETDKPWVTNQSHQINYFEEIPRTSKIRRNDDDPGLSMAYFTANSNLVLKVFLLNVKC